MRWGFVGFLIGIILGFYLPLNIPVEYSRYTAVGIVGIMDSVLGAIKAELQGKYKTSIFLTGLSINMILAVLITFIGDRLNLDLYLAILVAFMVRMLQNIGAIRYSFVDRFITKSERKPLA